jgi:hypothetical protein
MDDRRDAAHVQQYGWYDHHIQTKRGPCQNLKKVDIKYQLRLNPTKCTFNIRSKKLLGFVINSDEIKVDLDNIKVIQAMTTQSTKREV